MESFSVQVEHADAQTIVRLGGELDMATAPEVDAGVALALRQTSSGKCLVIDARDLVFCDVVGLRGLLRARDFATEYGCTFALRAPSAMLRRLVIEAGLSERLLAGEVHTSNRSAS